MLALTNHLALQLDLSLILGGEVPGRFAMKMEQFQRNREYLGWRPFDSDARTRLTTWLTQPTTADLLPGELLTRAEESLRSWQIVLPASSILEELVVSVTAGVQDAMYTHIVTGVLSALQRAMDAAWRSQVTNGRGLSRPKVSPSPTSDAHSVRIQTLNLSEA